MVDSGEKKMKGFDGRKKEREVGRGVFCCLRGRRVVGKTTLVHLGERVVEGLDVETASHETRHAHVDRGGEDVKGTSAAIRRSATSLLEDERERRDLVEVAELSGGCARVTRVHEDTSVEEGTVDIGHHGTDVTEGVAVVLDAIDVVFGGTLPEVAVTLVDRVDLAEGLGADVGVGEDELAERTVEREAIDTTAKGEDEHGGGTVEGVSRGKEVAAGLEDIGVVGGLVLRGDLLGNAKDRTDGDVGVDVGGAVEGIKVDDIVLGSAGKGVDEDGLGLFLRGDGTDEATLGQGVDKGLVGKDVELLDGFSLAVLDTSLTEETLEGGPVDGAGDHLAGQLDLSDDDGEIALLLDGVAETTLEEVLVESKDLLEGGRHRVVSCRVGGSQLFLSVSVGDVLLVFVFGG